MRAVAAGRLSVATDPVAGEREHERREPKRAERCRIDEEPCEEASDGARDAAAQQGERDERDEQKVGDGAEDVGLGEDRDLRNRRHKEQHGGLDAVEQAHRRWCVGTSTPTASSEPRFAKGCTCTWRKLAVSATPTDVTRPIGIPYG